MYSIHQISAMVEQGISRLPLPQKPERLYDPARYILSAGGKRIRPCLALMASNLFSDEISDFAEVALAMEVFHNFTLVHDDVMDNAALRRGIATVHEKWNLNTAILAGDVLMIKAYQLLSTIKNQHLSDALQMFNETALLVCEGQQQDMDFEQINDVQISQYLEMIKNKTSVLLGCSLFCGALAAGSDTDNATLLYNAGVSLGISFQIQDDLLDVYGDENKFGKKIGGDILQNKKTYLYVIAMQHANETEKTLLQNLYTDKFIEPQHKVDSVISLFNTLNVQKLAEQEKQKHFNVALTHIKEVKVPESRKMVLYELAEGIYNRNF